MFDILMIVTFVDVSTVSVFCWMCVYVCGFSM